MPESTNPLRVLFDKDPTYPPWENDVATPTMRTVRMTTAEWAAVPDSPRQRNTVAHSCKAMRGHLKTASPAHARVSAASINGQLVCKLDGHTRSYLWQSGKLSKPVGDVVFVDVYPVNDMAEANALYVQFDNAGAVEYRVPCNRDAVGHSLESRASSMQTIELTDFEDRALASGRLTQIRRDMDPQPTQAANGSLGWDGVLFWDQPQMLAERCPFGKPGSMFRVKSWTWADAPVYTIASVRVERVRSITQGDLLACGADGGPSMYHNWCLATGNNNPERWQWVIDFTSTEDCNDAQS